MKVDDNKNKLVMQFDRKTSDEVVESLDVSKENADVILAVTGKETDNEEFNLISDNINVLAQSKNANIEKTVNKLKDNPKAQLDTIKDIDDALIRTVNKHLSILQNSKSLGMASGDVNTKKIQLWGTTLYQKAKDTSSNGFSADTQGVVIGGDVNLNDNLLVGAGFSLQQTDLTSDNKKADIDSKSLFIYGEYSKDDWFVKPILSLNKLEYKQNKSVLGLNIGSKYDAEMIGAQFMVGKNMYYQVEENKYKIRPTVSFRYYHINKDGYTDSAGFNYEKSQNDILTTVLGIEVSETIKIKDISVLPIVYLNMTYDIVNDDIETLVRLPNGNSYITNSDNNEKLGFELGVSTEFNINDKIKMAVTYEYDWKKDYSSHLGLLKFKYQF